MVAAPGLGPSADPEMVDLTARALAFAVRDLTIEDRIRALSAAWDEAVFPALQTEAERVKLQHLRVPFPGREAP